MHDQPVLYSVDLSECRALGRFDAPALGAAFAEALARAGATIVEQTMHLFPGGGVTWVLVLRESHAVLHTWPETATVNIDIFSCSTRLRSLTAIEELGRLLGADGVAVHETVRADGRTRV